MLPSTTAETESECEKQILDASPDVLCLDTECRSEQGYSKQTGNAIELCVLRSREGNSSIQVLHIQPAMDGSKRDPSL